MHKEGICYLDKRGAIAVFVDVGSSSSRWFRRREGRSRVFCFPTKEMNHEERLGKSPFTGLPNVKGTVAEDARITDSPPRSEPVLEIRVRPRAGMLRCSRCGERRHGYDQGGGARRWRHQKIRRRRPDILRTIELGYSNARLEAFNNRIKVTIRTAYGFHHANNLIALIMLRCGGLDIRLPQPRTQPTKTAEASK